MKPGDLVKRYIPSARGYRQREAWAQWDQLGYGLVLSNHVAGDPPHPCVTVYYPKARKIAQIAESLMIVVYEVE